jgi:hypothetical protein
MRKLRANKFYNIGPWSQLGVLPPDDLPDPKIFTKNYNLKNLLNLDLFSPGAKR